MQTAWIRATLLCRTSGHRWPGPRPMRGHGRKRRNPSVQRSAQHRPRRGWDHRHRDSQDTLPCIAHRVLHLRTRHRRSCPTWCPRHHRLRLWTGTAPTSTATLDVRAAEAQWTCGGQEPEASSGAVSTSLVAEEAARQLRFDSCGWMPHSSSASEHAQHSPSASEHAQPDAGREPVRGIFPRRAMSQYPRDLGGGMRAGGAASSHRCYRWK